MQVTPVIITYENRWLWAVALAGGLLISSVITGLSVGLPLGLACCKYGEFRVLFKVIFFERIFS